MSRSFLAAVLTSTLLACASSSPGSTPLPTEDAEVAEPMGPTGVQSTKSADAASSEETPTADPLLASWSAALDEANKTLQAGDHAGARARIAEAIGRALGELGAREDEAALAILDQMGRFAREAGDLQSAREALSGVLEVRSRTLADEHPDLQKSQLILATTIKTLGDLAGARALEEKVLEIRTRTLPDEHPDLQAVRGNFARTIKALGDLDGARALEERVLDVRSRTLPDEHPELQRARANLAGTIKMLGDLEAARALQEKVLDVYSRTLPDEHTELQTARGSLASTIQAQGDLAGARVLQEKVLEVRLRTLPDEHPQLQNARSSLAATIATQGDLAGARVLQEKVLEVQLRTLPAEHRDLQLARANLAVTIKALGDLAGSRALLEQVLEVFSRTLPDEHPSLQNARLNLASTVKSLGDLAGARALEEKVLEVQSRSLPDEHPDLQKSRNNLAVTIKSLGDLAGARALQEKVLEVRSRTLPDEHRDLQRSRGNLASILLGLGDLDGARALQEKVLEVHTRVLLDDHPDLQLARGNLAATLGELGDLAGARALCEKVVEIRLRTLPDEHPDLQWARRKLAVTIAAEIASASNGEIERERGRCIELTSALCRSQTSAARAALLEASPREAEVRCQSLSEDLNFALSLAQGLGVFAPSPELEMPCYVLSETTRGAALASASLMRVSASSPRYAELKGEIGKLSEELAAQAQRGTTSEGFREARERREHAERELVALASEHAGGAAPDLVLDVDALAAKLEGKDALVAYRRYKRSSFEVAANEEAGSRVAPVASRVDSLFAFVLRRVADEPHLACVDLGPIEPIETAVRDWREALGVVDGRGVGVEGSQSVEATLLRSGETLRRLLLDQLATELTGITHVVVVLDDVLHLVPFDALPQSGSSGSLLGDRLRIETRATLTEMTNVAPRPTGEAVLVAVGDVRFDEQAALRGELPSLLRGGKFGGFQPLPATGAEVDALAEGFERQARVRAEASILRGSDATRERLIELAPRARFLHVATHGWFASESIRSWSDPEPLDRHTGLGTRISGEEQVKGMSPMLLCGLALAGANPPENAFGRAPGLVTADEIASLDLTQCELAVLSACDTNVGERSAGQGVASLQRALQMAGARSVITSLWKVPDEATRELMVDFYRRIWVEKTPKWQALWGAKMSVRNAMDESGRLKYSTRDWAAWVLTGEPE